MPSNPFGNTELLDCSNESCNKPFFRTSGSKREICPVCRAEARVQHARDELLVGGLQLTEAKISQQALMDFLGRAAPKYAAQVAQEMVSELEGAVAAMENEGLAQPNGAEAT